MPKSKSTDGTIHIDCFISWLNDFKRDGHTYFNLRDGNGQLYDILTVLPPHQNKPDIIIDPAE